MHKTESFKNPFTVNKFRKKSTVENQVKFRLNYAPRSPKRPIKIICTFALKMLRLLFAQNITESEIFFSF